MRTGFGVHGDDVGSSCREVSKVWIGRCDHQMDVENLFRCAAHGFNDGCPERDVRHEMPIHHVAVDPIGTGGIDGANFVGELAEIRRQDRWSNQQWARHRQTFSTFVRERSLSRRGDGVRRAAE